MKIPITLQLVVLTVAMTGFYMMVGQAVPQKEVHPPEIIEIAADISTEEMVEIGQEIFNGKGLCSTCHTIGKSGALRFPDLDGIATRAASRKPGLGALDYLAESLYEPNVFIVDGFTAGMPEINKPPIGLTDQEILAVIAFLQTLGGEPTVTMATKLAYTGGQVGGGEAPAADAAAGEALAVDAAAADTVVLAGGAALLERQGCTRCHYADRPGKLQASSLFDVGSRYGADELFLKLSHHEKEPQLDQATLSELQSLVQTLTDMKGAQG